LGEIFNGVHEERFSPRTGLPFCCCWASPGSFVLGGWSAICRSGAWQGLWELLPMARAWGKRRDGGPVVLWGRPPNVVQRCGGLPPGPRKFFRAWVQACVSFCFPTDNEKKGEGGKVGKGKRQQKLFSRFYFRDSAGGLSNYWPLGFFFFFFLRGPKKKKNKKKKAEGSMVSRKPARRNMRFRGPQARFLEKTAKEFFPWRH